MITAIRINTSKELEILVASLEMVLIAFSVMAFREEVTGTAICGSHFQETQLNQTTI